MLGSQSPEKALWEHPIDFRLYLSGVANSMLNVLRRRALLFLGDWVFPIQTVEFAGFIPSKIGGVCDRICTSKPPLKLIARSKLTFDEEVEVHRVGGCRITRRISGPADPERSNAGEHL